MKCFVVSALLCAALACSSAAPAPAPQAQQAQFVPQHRSPAPGRFQQQLQQQGGSLVNIALTRSSAEEPIVILRQVQDFQLPGTYSWSYETENGIQAAEAGELKNEGTQDEANSVQGSYSYTGLDGVLYSVSYVADDTGFHAEGAHLPQPPAVPEEIQRALEYIRSQPGFREDDDGQYRKEYDS